MRVLGIDCGVERTGFGVVSTDGYRCCFIDAGVIVTNAKAPLPERLRAIASGLREVVERRRPNCVAVEEVFHAVNVKTALRLAHVRGVSLLVAAECGLEVAEYSPLEIKTSVVGYGRAEKQQVQMMVRSLLGLPAVVESEDASDALAVAICHSNHHATAVRLMPEVAR